MRDLKKQQLTAIEAVARRFSATWEKGSSSRDAYVTIAGKRVAIDMRTLKLHGTGQGDGAKPRLRFDKVATRVVEHLRATLGETVPNDKTAAVTVTAPIRLASKTAASLEGKIQTLLSRGLLGRDEKDTIHGNRVQIRISNNGSGQAPKIIGFVHNSDTDPHLLLNMTREFLELLNAEAGKRAAKRAPKRAPKRADERWLVVISARGSSCLGAYRYIYSQLRMATSYKKVLMVFSDGRIEALME